MRSPQRSVGSVLTVPGWARGLGRVMVAVTVCVLFGLSVPGFLGGDATADAAPVPAFPSGAAIYLAGAQAVAVNAEGEVVGGDYAPEDGDDDNYGFVWEDGTTTNVGVLSADSEYSELLAVNDLGEAAGYGDTGAQDDDDSNEAVLWDGSSLSALGFLDNYLYQEVDGQEQVVWAPSSKAYAINDSNLIVGSATTYDADTGDTDTHPVEWDGGPGPDELTSADGEALDVNNAGTIVGYLDEDGVTVPAMWGTDATDIGLPPGATTGVAVAVNDEGQVLVNADAPGEFGLATPWIWTAGSWAQLPPVSVPLPSGQPGGQSSAFVPWLASGFDDSDLVVGTAYLTIDDPPSELTWGVYSYDGYGTVASPLQANVCCNSIGLDDDPNVSIDGVVGDHIVGDLTTSGGESGFYLATLTLPLVVNTGEDLPNAYPSDGVCADVNQLCSLRGALQLVQPGETIAFDLPPEDDNTVNIDSELPDVPEDVTVNGTSEGGGTVTLTPAADLDTCLTLTGSDEVDGLSIGGCGTGVMAGGDDDSLHDDDIGIGADGATPAPNGVGIEVAGDNTVIGGPLEDGYSTPMVVSDNTTAGIQVDAGATGTTVQRTFVGVAADGATPAPNGGDGVDIAGSGAIIAPDDTISSNDGFGVEIDGNDNEVAGDVIGPDSTNVGNTSGGVDIDNSSGNEIGDPGEGLNVISGNGGPGVEVDGASSGDNVIAENYIGLGASGEQALPNAADGIFVNGAPDTTIGTASGFNNVAGNAGNGIDIAGATASGTTLVNNYVGVNHDAISASPNGGSGILINGAPDTEVGSPAAFNTIGGNTGDGVTVTGSGATGTVIGGNYIGVAYTGTTSIGNGGDGVDINGAPGTEVGTADAFNLISANFGDGVLAVDAPDTVVAGDFIGTDYTGEVPMGNVGAGVSLGSGSDGSVVGAAVTDEAVPDVCSGACDLISGNLGSGVSIDGATGVTVGGDFIGSDRSGTSVNANGGDGITVTSSGNTIEGDVISGNVGNGVTVSGTSDTTITGNAIGSDPTGVDDVPNGLAGVTVEDSSSTTIGGGSGATTGTCAAPCNVISGNIGDGVDMTAGSTGTTLTGDDIGTDATGTQANPNAAGVTVAGSPDNTVSNDLISANEDDGVDITGAASTGEMLQGDVIGLASDGVSPLGNGGNGVHVAGAPGVTIGGSGPGEGNVISANSADGVDLGSGATSAVLEGNYVGTSASGEVAAGNAGDGIDVAGASSTVGGVSGIAPGTACAGACNVISGNGGTGVTVSGRGVTVAGNAIGSAADGSTPLPNDGDGVLVNSATGATVGGTPVGAGNLIVDNEQTGVDVTGSTAVHNAILGNALYNNGALGIGLGGGANNSAPYPAISSVVIGASTTTLTSTLDSFPSTSFQVQFFASPSCDPSGYGQGEFLVDAVNVKTGASGQVTFSQQVANAAFPSLPTTVITATATVTSGPHDGDTSEFSQCVTPITKLGQTIGFAHLAGKTLVESPVMVSATATSGLPVSFTTTTPLVCIPEGTNGASIILLTTGKCTVRATQPGNARIKPAPPVSRSFTVSMAKQTISFAALTTTTLARSPVTVTATATSGLPVGFTTTTPLVCTSGGTNGATIALLTTGKCTVQADQTGNTTYKAARPVSRSFTVRT
jgi:hypothetical protein